MAGTTKDVSLSVRITTAERQELDALAALRSAPPTALAAAYIAEGVRRSRFPAIDFRDGFPGRIAYLTGTRWPVWLVVDLVKELSGNVAKAAKRVRRPPALIEMALRYAAAYPEEIAAAQRLGQDREAAA